MNAFRRTSASGHFAESISTFAGRAGRQSVKRENDRGRPTPIGEGMMCRRRMELELRTVRTGSDKKPLAVSVQRRAVAVSTDSSSSGAH